MFKNPFVLISSILATIISLVLIIGTVTGIWWLWDRSLPISVLSVQGTASQKVKYDKVTLNLTISLVGSDVSLLNTEIDTKTTKIIDYLKLQGISENDIQTNKSSYPDYSTVIYDSSSKPNSSTQQGSNQTRVENNFIVILNDFGTDNSKPNKVIAEVTKLGVNRFGGFNYDFKDNKAICNNLENTATENAWQKAQDKIKALGGGRVVKKTTNFVSGCGNNNYPMMYNSMAKAEPITGTSQETPPSVLGGEQELTSSIELTVEYK